MGQSAMPCVQVQRILWNVALLPGQKMRDARWARQMVRMALKRARAKMVAFLSDDQDVQSLLPQVPSVNAKHISEQDFKEVQDRHDQVHVLRWKSHWVTVEVMLRILKLVDNCLSTLRETHHLLLCIDVCPVHGRASVAKACGQSNQHLFMLLAKMISVMQPLDTHVFSKLKRTWKRLHDGATL